VGIGRVRAEVSGPVDSVGWPPISIVEARAMNRRSASRPLARRTVMNVTASRGRSVRAARRRRRRLARVEHDLTVEQWTALKGSWGGCAYCGTSDGVMQRDCVLPISRGGRYTLSNVVPACGPCNASKCNSEVTGWLRRRRLDEQRFLLRHVEISRALRGE
jgi:5-methylcytosine-specific restriction endonuclease McrA